VYREQGRFPDADSLYRQAIDIREVAGDPTLDETVADYVKMLRAAGRPADADAMERRLRR
jgi:hypothetical protein